MPRATNGLLTSFLPPDHCISSPPCVLLASPIVSSLTLSSEKYLTIFKHDVFHYVVLSVCLFLSKPLLLPLS
jgi:hypothetical protein